MILNEEMTIKDALEIIYELNEQNRKAILERHINKKRRKEVEEYYRGVNNVLREIMLRMIAMEVLDTPLYKIRLANRMKDSSTYNCKLADVDGKELEAEVVLLEPESS